MRRREFLARSTGAFAAAMGLAGNRTAQAAAGRKQNVLLIVADDLGYGDLGCYGGNEIPTPHIDSIAANGVRFTNGYVTCPVCSPMRAGLLTGRYQQRFGHEFNPGPPDLADPQFGLPLTETTIADRLKALGYATGMFGKWHLGYKPEFHPQRRGFDEFYGFLGGQHWFFDDKSRNPGDPVLRGTEPVKSHEYLTNEFAREAAAFVEKHKSHPFFCFLPFNAVHSPLQAPPEYVERFNHIADEKRRTYAGMLSAMDDGVGVVLKKLKELELLDDTLVIFISDNGGPTSQTTSKNDPLRAAKGTVYEGGIRVPFMMQWGERFKKGAANDTLAASIDILPTAVSAAGGEISADWKMDGVDLVPFLTGKREGSPHETLYWRFGRQHAIRSGDWKLAQSLESKDWELYNLAQDIGETRDLARQDTGKVNELRAKWDAWSATLEPPRWENRQPRPNQQRQAQTAA